MSLVLSFCPFSYFQMICNNFQLNFRRVSIQFQCCTFTSWSQVIYLWYLLANYFKFSFSLKSQSMYSKYNVLNDSSNDLFINLDICLYFHILNIQMIDQNQLNKQDENQLHRVERQNIQKLYDTIQKKRTNIDIQQYKEAFRNLYYEQGLFKTKKSKELLQKNLQDLNPSLHYTEQTEYILKNIAKVFLMELFEQAIEVRQKLIHKKEIDEEMLEEAYRRLKNKQKTQKF